MATSLQLAQGNPTLFARVMYCRSLLNRRALVAAAASAVPVPGLDWAVDAALLSRLVGGGSLKMDPGIESGMTDKGLSSRPPSRDPSFSATYLKCAMKCARSASSASFRP